MIFRGLDPVDYDWEFGKGKQSYVRDQDAVTLNIRTRLYMFKNDCFFSMNGWIDWVEYLGAKNTDKALGLECRSIILKTEGVTRMNSLSTALVGRLFSASYNIDTVYSLNQNQTMEIVNA